MWVLQAIGLFLAAAAWRLTGSKRFGEVLIRSLSAENENLKNIAGILIVRAGKNAEPLLQDALRRRENLPMTLSLLRSRPPSPPRACFQPLTGQRDLPGADRHRGHPFLDIRAKLEI